MVDIKKGGLARTLSDLDDDALARAAAVLGTKTKVDTVNSALRLVGAGSHDAEGRRRFDELVNLVGERLAEVDVRTETWR